MDFFSLYFKKSFEKVTLEDLISFFKESHSESNRIEFKSFKSGGKIDEKLKPIITSICAFLNSEGGILIWGAPMGQSQPNKKEKIFSGYPTFVEEYIETDKLINKITDSISPLPVGVSIRAVGDSSKYIYLFSIQSSVTKPHQFDNKYLIRLDGQTRIAPHYYIESMFRQVKYPNMEGYIKFCDVLLVKEGFELNIETYIFNWSPLQNERNVIISLSSSIGVFKDYGAIWNVNNKYHEYREGGHQSLTRRLDDILFYGSPFNSSYKLIFQNSNIIGQEAEFILRFGGESSPQKESYYKFKLDINGKNDPYVNILEMSENKLISEIRSAIGISKEEVIRNIIGR